MEDELDLAQQRMKVHEIRTQDIELLLDSIEKATERLQKLGLENAEAVIVAAELHDLHLESSMFTNDPRTSRLPRVA